MATNSGGRGPRYGQDSLVETNEVRDVRRRLGELSKLIQNISADSVLGIFNVKDYGAKGNGTTDDTKAINTALYACYLARGGIVFVPPGIYIVTHLEMFQAVTLMGAGREASILKLKDKCTAADYVTDRSGHAAGGFIMIYSSYPSGGYNNNLPLDSICVRDLTIDGNAANQTSSESGWGIYLNGITRCLLENLEIKNCLSHGWTLKESTYGTVRGCKSSGNGASTHTGDAGVIYARSSYNLVIDCESENDSYGYEDEGRFGSYNPVNRNSYNRWVNITVKNSPNNAWDAVFADHCTVENLQVVGGISTNNAGSIQLIGCTDVRIDGLRCYGSSKDAIRIWPEVFGADGVNRRIRITNAVLYSTTNRPIHLEGAEDVRIEARIRGTTSAYAVAMTAYGYGRTGGAVGTDPATAAADHSSGGYGIGDYAVGKAYIATGQYPAVWSGVGDYVRSDGAVWRLSSAFTGSGLSVTAPTHAGAGFPNVADNGGVWTWMNEMGSTNTELRIDLDATQPAAWVSGTTYVAGDLRVNSNIVYRCEIAGAGASTVAPSGTLTSPSSTGADGYTWYYQWTAYQPTYGIYAFNPTTLWIRDTVIKGVPNQNIWVDGTAAGSSGVVVTGTKSTGSGQKGMALTASNLTGQNSYAWNCDFTGNSVALNLTSFMPQFQTFNVAGVATTTWGTAAPGSGTWAAGTIVKNSAPAVGSPKGWVCTVAGTPGTWVSEGNL